MITVQCCQCRKYMETREPETVPPGITPSYMCEECYEENQNRLLEYDVAQVPIHSRHSDVAV